MRSPFENRVLKFVQRYSDAIDSAVINCCIGWDRNHVYDASVSAGISQYRHHRPHNSSSTSYRPRSIRKRTRKPTCQSRQFPEVANVNRWTLGTEVKIVCSGHKNDCWQRWTDYYLLQFSRQLLPTILIERFVRESSFFFWSIRPPGESLYCMMRFARLLLRPVASRWGQLPWLPLS